MLICCILVTNRFSSQNKIVFFYWFRNKHNDIFFCKRLCNVIIGCIVNYIFVSTYTLKMLYTTLMINTNIYVRNVISTYLHVLKTYKWRKIVNGKIINILSLYNLFKLSLILFCWIFGVYIVSWPSYCTPPQQLSFILGFMWPKTTSHGANTLHASKGINSELGKHKNWL